MDTPCRVKWDIYLVSYGREGEQGKGGKGGEERREAISLRDGKGREQRLEMEGR